MCGPFPLNFPLFPLIFPLFRHAPPPPVGDIESGDSFRYNHCCYDVII